MGTERDPLIGRIIADRYEVVSLINSGGMGVVYRANQRSLDRPVAVKLIHPQQVSSERAVERFMYEARAVSRLNHPHVVSVFDFGKTADDEGGYLFLVMELLTGPDLARVMALEAPLPIARIADITLQTLEALAEAHHLGIVHRDIKPENIILESRLSGQDHVKIIDFGIAEIGAGRASADRVAGTPGYMAPELRSGVSTESVDIFSTGAMLFELLTGKLPSPEAVVSGDLSALDPRKMAPRRAVPENLAAACVRALAADPGRRFPNAQAFASCIRAAMLDAGIGASSGSWERAPWGSALRRASAPTMPTVPSRDIDPTSGLESLSQGPQPDETMRNLGATHLFGRDQDLAWACELLRADPPPVVAFWGRSGIGRTRLVNEVASVAETEEHLVVTVPLPPHPASEVGYIGLRRVVRALAGLTFAELMDDRVVSPVDRWALMGLRHLYSKAKLPSEPQLARRAAEAALSWGMERARARSARGSVILVLDDLDRLDGASMLALRDRLEGEPGPGVTVLCASQHARRVVLLPHVRERMLRGLSREDSAKMLAALTEDRTLPRVEDDIAPLYVRELALLNTDRADSVPLTLDEIVAMRMSPLSTNQKRVLQALAVAGALHGESLAALLRYPTDLETTLDSLIAAGFIERRGAHVLLCHRLYGTVALSTAQPDTIAKFHKGAAHQLRDARQLSELAAYHAIRGARDFEAFVMLEDVARLRTARGDSEGALSVLTYAVSAAREQVALAETSAASAALGIFGRKLASALIAAGRTVEARSILEEVLRVAKPRELTRAAALEQLATIADRHGQADEAARRRREALDIAERTDDQKLKARLREALSGIAAPKAPSSQPELLSAMPEPGGPRPVLVVEDDRSIREGLEAVLEAEGYQVFGAGNGREALDLLHRIPRPGLILLDLMMPVMSGWEMYEALRADDAFADIPVVVVSAVAERNRVAASCVLRKPVEIGKLLSIVEELCK